MSNRTTWERVTRLIKAATGSEYDDQQTIVYEIAAGYCEPDYPNCGIVVLGDWNDKTKWDSELKRSVSLTNTKADTVPGRLYAALKRIPGVECDWHDEYVTCDECYKAFRSSADSYSWTFYGAWNGDGYTCASCIKDDPTPFIDQYVNDSDKAITWADENLMEKNGWVKVENDNSYSGDYHNGWYGREDNPASIMADLHDLGHEDVVFLIEGTGQFEISFAPYVRGDADAKYDGRNPYPFVSLRKAGD